MNIREQKLRYEYSYEYPPQDTSDTVFSDNGDVDEIRDKLETSLERAFENPDLSKLTVEKVRVRTLRGSSDEEWAAFESTEESQDLDDEQTTIPETAAEWETWYPCPECRSTDLNQVIESHLSVSGTQDGSYGGEDSIEEYNYVECANCGTVLLDEIGRS